MKTARLLIAALLFPTACSEGAKIEPPGRVLLLGIDGASLEIIEPMIAEGKLPNLEALTRSGTWGPLRSLKPMLSPLDTGELHFGGGQVDGGGNRA